MSAQSDYDDALVKLRAEQARKRAESGFYQSPGDKRDVPEMVIPRDILITLFRGLIHCGDQITREQSEKAWGWLEDHNHYEEMGQ